MKTFKQILSEGLNSEHCAMRAHEEISSSLDRLHAMTRPGGILHKHIIKHGSDHKDLEALHKKLGDCANHHDEVHQSHHFAINR